MVQLMLAVAAEDRVLLDEPPPLVPTGGYVLQGPKLGRYLRGQRTKISDRSWLAEYC